MLLRILKYEEKKRKGLRVTLNWNLDRFEIDKET